MMKTMMFLGAVAVTMAAPAAAKDIAKKQADPAAIKCKRFPVIGSLVQTTKICKTEAEWRLARDNTRDAYGGAQPCAGGMTCNPN